MAPDRELVTQAVLEDSNIRAIGVQTFDEEVSNTALDVVFLDDNNAPMSRRRQPACRPRQA